MEYFSCFGSIVTSYTRRTREIKSRIAVAKAAFNKKRAFFYQDIGFKN